MSKTLKGLATISAWVLFVSGVATILYTSIYSLTRSGGINGELYNFADISWYSLATLSVFLAVVALKIRKELE